MQQDLELFRKNHDLFDSRLVRLCLDEGRKIQDEYKIIQFERNNRRGYVYLERISKGKGN